MGSLNPFSSETYRNQRVTAKANAKRQGEEFTRHQSNVSRETSGRGAVPV
jgi:hypothetical protein